MISIRSRHAFVAGQVCLRRTIFCAVVGLASWSSLAAADEVVLADIFDGSEPSTGVLPGTCFGAGQLPYQEVDFEAGASGTYQMVDALEGAGVDIVANIYQGSFNVNNPNQNLLTPGGIDTAGSVNLNPGTDYVLVLQQWCRPGEGAWALAIAGPGSISSSVVRNVPNFTSGNIDGSEPFTNSGCGNSSYEQFGPIQVSQSGTYYYSDISIAYDIDMCMQIYTAPFNAANPGQNLLDGADDFGTFELQAGQDYYFVVQPLSSQQLGDYFFVFAPPAEFRINAAMSGAWTNPATFGQGFFLDVFDNLNLMFLAWFTYDLERPDESVVAQIGDPGHRWNTAFGGFEMATAVLDIEWTVGGVFDATSPVPKQSLDGEITLEFSDCLNGTVTYDLGSSGVKGNFPIGRLANDSELLCQSLTEGPAPPGPL